MMLARIKIYLLGVAAFVATVFGIYLKGKRAGREEIDVEHARRRVEAMKRAKDVRDEIQDDTYFVDRAQQWVRKDKR